MDLDAVKRWRRGERERLLALRQAVPADERRRLGAAIETELRAPPRDAARHPRRVLAVSRRVRPAAADRLGGRRGPHGRAAGRDRQEGPARIPRLAPRRDAGRRRLEHPGPGKARDRHARRSCWRRWSVSTAPAIGSAMAAAISTGRWRACRRGRWRSASASSSRRWKRSIRRVSTCRWVRSSPKPARAAG